jgi:hypothetical protein
MKVAALYDIHGNLPALEAVLDEIRGEGVGRVVVGGDVVPGPMPRETIDRLLSLDLPVEFIYGNGEAAVLEQLAGRGRVPGPLPARNSGRRFAPATVGDRGWPRRTWTFRESGRAFLPLTPRNE